jgi:anti-sigma regulatory factor (Ser/Thr protein kinase)
MTSRVAVATDLDSLAFVLHVQPDDPDDAVLTAVDVSAAQHPAAVVVDLAADRRPGPGLLRAISQRCSQYAVPLLVVPLLAGTVPEPRSFRTVPAALASLPHAALRSEHRLAVSLPAAVTAPAQARTVAGDALRGWHLDDLLVASELVVSELVSNAVQHAATAMDLLVQRTTRGIRISVRDGSPKPPQVAGHDPSDVAHPRGRGLFLVSVTAARWGFLVGSVDKVVWATIEK